MVSVHQLLRRGHPVNLKQWWVVDQASFRISSSTLKAPIIPISGLSLRMRCGTASCVPCGSHSSRTASMTWPPAETVGSTEKPLSTIGLTRSAAITEADTLLLTVPNQLGVAYNAHVIEAILTHVAPALGWR
jgi:hypothetical protein